MGLKRTEGEKDRGLRETITERVSWVGGDTERDPEIVLCGKSTIQQINVALLLEGRVCWEMESQEAEFWKNWKVDQSLKWIASPGLALGWP